ncbi:hypothetical protein CEXT_324411 [Caerostris extrusa]|uniref:Uncharacterized protein n=1 Tax=Caerostris extrusa TaxID=172846 RepID=A0AAV4UT03_CAEEX|nr:hypothetical protein CEXT_324411 [Caerostris extrusa]
MGVDLRNKKRKGVDAKEVRNNRRATKFAVINKSISFRSSFPFPGGFNPKPSWQVISMIMWVVEKKSITSPGNKSFAHANIEKNFRGGDQLTLDFKQKVKFPSLSNT